MTLIKQTGGSRVGQSYWKAVRASWPLASLRVEENEIVLSVLFSRDRHYPKEQITRLSRYKEPLGTSLRIEHTVPSAAPYVLFRTSNYGVLAAALKQAGYPIVDNDQNFS
jgi:hypothetical protein